jgi:hypothetical protein
MANLERLKAQAATAGEKQALEQEQLNLAYQQFQEEQDYQRRLLEYQSNILRGNAAALRFNSSTICSGSKLSLTNWWFRFSRIRAIQYFR